MPRLASLLAALLLCAIPALAQQGGGPPSNGTAAPTGAAGGDLGGTYPNPTVLKTGGVSFGAFATGTDATNLTGTIAAGRLTGAGYSFTAPAIGAATGTSLALGAGSAVTSTGAGGALVASAFTDATNASNIASGTLPSGRLTGAYTGAVANGGVTFQSLGAANRNTASTSEVMLGFGATCTITPAISTRVMFTMGFDVIETIGGANEQERIRFGTGTAPTNGAALTGTAITAFATNDVTTGNTIHATLIGITTGLTPATAYWFDLGALVGSGTGTWGNMACNAVEI